MGNEALNYELMIYNGDFKKIFETDFHGDDNDLAHDHALHVLRTYEDGLSCFYRKKGNKKWKSISLTNNKKTVINQ